MSCIAQLSPDQLLVLNVVSSSLNLACESIRFSFALHRWVLVVSRVSCLTQFSVFSRLSFRLLQEVRLEEKKCGGRKRGKKA